MGLATLTGSDFLLIVILLGPSSSRNARKGGETWGTVGWALPANSRFIDFTRNDKT